MRLAFLVHKFKLLDKHHMEIYEDVYRHQNSFYGSFDAPQRPQTDKDNQKKTDSSQFDASKRRVEEEKERQGLGNAKFGFCSSNKVSKRCSCCRQTIHPTFTPHTKNITGTQIEMLKSLFADFRQLL